MNIKLNTKKGILILSLLGPMMGHAQSLNKETYFSNPLFNVMIGVIIFLLIVIVVLSQALKNLGKSDYLIKSKDAPKDSTNIKIPATVLFFFLALNSKAQAPGNHPWQVGGVDVFTFYILLSIILLQIIVVMVLLHTLNFLLRDETEKKVMAQAKKEKSILEILNASVEIEEEAGILMDHDYDGIKELDNNLPPWWKYGFYLTVFVSVVYMVHYHISNTGDSQIAEYNKEIEKGRKEVEEYMKMSAGNVDETTVKMMKGEDLAEGKNIFISTCSACHGKFGEGGVGPNLTDSFWINGGNIVDIFKVIKYGKPDKGMKSWKEDISPLQIAQVSSYIKTLLNTNPLNPKAKQGDLFIEKQTIINDSAGVTKDSIPALPLTIETKGPVAETNKK